MIQRKDNNGYRPAPPKPAPPKPTLSNNPLKNAALPASVGKALAQGLKMSQAGSPVFKALQAGDQFRTAAQNIFNNIKSALPKEGQRLLGNPAMQQALGPFNPQKLLASAKQEAQRLTFGLDKLQGTKMLWQGGISGSKGKGPDFVEAGLAGASGRGPVGLGLVDPKNMKTKEFNVSQGTQNKINKAGQFLDQAGKIASQAEGIANQLGINTTIYEKSGSKQVSKSLWGDVDGPNHVGAYAKSEGGVRVGLTGIEAAGRAEAGIEARVGVSGKTTGKYGTAEGSASAQVSAKASADGRASIGPNGLSAEGNLYAGVSASAEAQGRLESKPIATVGGVPITLQAEGKAKVEAGAYAYANAKVNATWNPPALAVDAKAGAFAGARASAEGSVGVGPLKATGKAEGWAGVGFEANFNAGYKDGKLKLSFGIGAALGIGGKLSGGIEIDVGAIGRAVKGVVQDVGKGIEKAAKGVVDTAKKVGTAVVDTFKNVGKSVGNFFKKIKIF